MHITQRFARLRVFPPTLGIILSLALSCAYAQDNGSTCNSPTPPDVLTLASYHGPLASNVNPTRTGVNPCETTLVANDWQTSFGEKAQFTTPCPAGPVCSTAVPNSPVYAQVLYKSGVTIGGGTHNIVIIATLDDYLFAYDADNTTSPTEYWVGMSGNPGINLISDRGDCGSGGATISQPGAALPRAGIVSTPVIDPSSMVIYVVGGCEDTLGLDHWFLHRLSLTDGSETMTSTYPVDVGGIASPVTVPAGYGASGQEGSSLPLYPNYQLQREALTQVLTTDGPPASINEIFIGFGVTNKSETAYSDTYHGWLAGYPVCSNSYPSYCSAATNFTFAATPYGPTSNPDSPACTTGTDIHNLCGLGGGNWMAGKGPAVLFYPPSGFSIYLGTGNGGFQTDGGTCTNCSDSILAFGDFDLSVLGASPFDFFTPYTDDTNPCLTEGGAVPSPPPKGYRKMNCYDQDMSTSGTTIANVSGTNYLVTFDKTGQGYAPALGSFGGFASGDPNANEFPGSTKAGGTCDGTNQDASRYCHQIVSEAYWQDSAGDAGLFLMPRLEDIDGCLWNGSTFVCVPTTVSDPSEGIKPAGGPGGTLAVTANAVASPNLPTAILWALFPGKVAGAEMDPAVATYPGYLGAYSMAVSAGAYSFSPKWESWNDSSLTWKAAPMDPPTIVNGRVYMPTYDSGVYVLSF
jgi:hypothetical protein